MKKLIPVLVLALLLTACSTAPPQTTAPPETTLPPETAPVTLPPPPETTLPPETTVPTEPPIPETTVPPVLEVIPGEFLPQEEAEGYYSLFTFTPNGDNWLLYAMSCVYDDPSQLNLNYYFYMGFPNDGCDWKTISESLTQLLLEHNFGTYGELQELPPDQMNDILLKTFGISLEEITSGIPENWVYAEETGCYYANHNDAWFAEPEYLGVVLDEDGSVRIYYINHALTVLPDGGFVDDSLMVMTMKRSYGEWQVLSNQLAEDLHLGPDFRGMTLTQLQDWFYDFARTHCFHEMPDFSREYGPHKEASTYLYWVYAHDPADPEDEMMIVTREQLEQMVQTYFGITPGDHRGDPHSWSYDPETGIYSQYNGIMAYPDFYLFNSMEYIDGVYTIYATRYTSRLIPDNPEEDLQLKNALIQGDHKNLIATSDVVVSFRLNPETGEPFFLDYDEFRFIDGFPRP